MLLPSVQFNDADQRFHASGEAATAALVAQMPIPLSLTFQLTRNCNFRCVYCSEPPGVRSRPLGEVKEMVDKLAGMRRIIFSGGEPMAYKHFWEVLEHARGKFEKVVLSTNASLVTREGAARLKDLVDYVDVTVDGPRRQHDLIRGRYELVVRGLRRIAEQEIPLSVICVYLPANRDAVHYICHTGDVFGAVKVKILTPIPKGMGRNLFDRFTTGGDLTELADRLGAEKARNGWRVSRSPTG
jgi:MoaA/NifB/PqqE/SkfB family radical SAM enzyme